MRYFLEVSYKGTKYAGFQIQKNAKTIQSEVERALFIFFRSRFSLTGSSRTDAGVHALQNYFHVDSEVQIPVSAIYNLNSILPCDIVIKSVKRVDDTAHCRFDAISREYAYYTYSIKNPFLSEKAWYFPYPLDVEVLQSAADIVLTNKDFSAFSKKNQQPHNNICHITKSSWINKKDYLIYKVKANRFLRGMVKALVATMIQTARGKISIKDFKNIFNFTSNIHTDFSAPSHGLLLTHVNYPVEIFEL